MSSSTSAVKCPCCSIRRGKTSFNSLEDARSKVQTAAANIYDSVKVAIEANGLFDEETYLDTLTARIMCLTEELFNHTLKRIDNHINPSLAAKEIMLQSTTVDSHVTDQTGEQSLISGEEISTPKANSVSQPIDIPPPTTGFKVEGGSLNIADAIIAGHPPTGPTGFKVENGPLTFANASIGGFSQSNTSSDPIVSVLARHNVPLNLFAPNRFVNVIVSGTKPFGTKLITNLLVTDWSRNCSSVGTRGGVIVRASDVLSLNNLYDMLNTSFINHTPQRHYLLIVEGILNNDIRINLLRLLQDAARFLLSVIIKTDDRLPDQFYRQCQKVVLSDPNHSSLSCLRPILGSASEYDDDFFEVNLNAKLISEALSSFIAIPNTYVPFAILSPTSGTTCSISCGEVQLDSPDSSDSD